jgi:cell wall-associated NlpC family hydrolase
MRQDWNRRAAVLVSALVSATVLAACGSGGTETEKPVQVSSRTSTSPGTPAPTPVPSAPTPAEPAPPPDNVVLPPLDEPPPILNPVPPVPLVPAPPLAAGCTYPDAVQTDFAARDKLPQFVPQNSYGSWGPWPARYAVPAIPANCESGQWQRERVLAVAKKYIGLGYRHHHVPVFDAGDGTGLDCSNFTAWVYNYGLGVSINSGIGTQAETAGRRLAGDEPLRAGDLLFITSADGSAIAHVVIYIDRQHIIDSTGPGVQVRPFKGWYVSRFSHARRIIE